MGGRGGSSGRGGGGGGSPKSAEGYEKAILGGIQTADLQGTPKQVAWAEDIREAELNTLARTVGEVLYENSNSKRPLTNITASEFVTAVNGALSTKASWWIDFHKGYRNLSHEILKSTIDSFGDAKYGEMEKLLMFARNRRGRR